MKMKMKKYILNHKGFSLMGVLISAGIGVIVIIGITSQQLSLAKQAKTLNTKLFIDSAMSFLESNFNTFCKTTLPKSRATGRVDGVYVYTFTTVDSYADNTQQWLRFDNDDDGIHDYILKNKEGRLLGENYHVALLNLHVPKTPLDSLNIGDTYKGSDAFLIVHFEENGINLANNRLIGPNALKRKIQNINYEVEKLSAYQSKLTSCSASGEGSLTRCNPNRENLMRYNPLSEDLERMQYCDGENWVNIPVDVPTKCTSSITITLSNTNNCRKGRNTGGSYTFTITDLKTIEGSNSFFITSRAAVRKDYWCGPFYSPFTITCKPDGEVDTTTVSLPMSRSSPEGGKVIVDTIPNSTSTGHHSLTLSYQPRSQSLK